jgi:hypothetical protein
MFVRETAINTLWYTLKLLLFLLPPTATDLQAPDFIRPASKEIRKHKRI